MLERAYLTTLADGTVKQVNPFTGTEVWTVPGRGNRPLTAQHSDTAPLRDARRVSHCAFCSDRYLETPPEKSRVIRVGAGWETRHDTAAGELHGTLAEFRRVPNLFEILSYDYWRLNHGYELPAAAAARRQAYLADGRGRAHVLSVVRAKLRASGMTQEAAAHLSESELLAHADGFFGGGHDVVIARRHFTDDAADDSGLASSGTLSIEEHRRFIVFTAESAAQLAAANAFASYVAVFQNWLRPAGASFDHLHKQLVAIDELGATQTATLARVATQPNLFNDAGANYAAARGLVIARTEHAVAWAGFGHRYPSIEICSATRTALPWEQSAEEIDSMSDLLHALHAAAGPGLPCNEEWYYQPPGVEVSMPWRVLLKWRISTLAGFEGATRIYLNTISPHALRDRVVDALLDLRAAGRIAPQISIGDEVTLDRDPLQYGQPR